MSVFVRGCVLSSCILGRLFSASFSIYYPYLSKKKKKSKRSFMISYFISCKVLCLMHLGSLYSIEKKKEKKKT